MITRFLFLSKKIIFIQKRLHLSKKNVIFTTRSYFIIKIREWKSILLIIKHIGDYVSVSTFSDFSRLGVGDAF